MHTPPVPLNIERTLTKKPYPGRPPCLCGGSGQRRQFTAAGKIHTDFEKGFIMAEVMKFDDFKEEGSEAAAKAAGKYRQQGRNYVVEDGDIIFFKFNAGAGLKDAKKK
ncbi:hypothetical protein RUM43_005278 [Polyplax serrata]|uniref:YchF C-terminal domain-containing protein n=1 Tax=Polyplax serrata TaxID=468196 RepID=A0AAN8S4N2_POLSC